MKSLFFGDFVQVVVLPRNLSFSSIGSVVKPVLDFRFSSGDKVVGLDFRHLQFADAAGLVGLGNLANYLHGAGVNVQLLNVRCDSAVVRYMDDAGFFEEFSGNRLDEESALRETTVPFLRFAATSYVGYLHGKLAPWISREVSLSDDSISIVRTCLEEAFHNVHHHSGVDGGCTLSQFYPKKNQLSFALSDYGRGIPALVRTVENIQSDARCIRRACDEGFSTKSNVRNRGAGLAILIRYVVAKNGGSVEIRSGMGLVVARAHNGGVMYAVEDVKWAYPGTLVHVTLRTDTLEKLDDSSPEEFSW